ncbi:MAG: sigma-70 family RNA polymerase sigma factor [bacterium]|nr:sigma-70 family RNA polymerase sigma factor [bacterium]
MAPMNQSDCERWFLAMYESHADAIFRFCCYKLRDREAAVEITQDTFTRIWEYIARGKTIEHFRAFAFRTARNAIADYVKKARPLYEHDLAEVAERLLDHSVESTAPDMAELSGVLGCLRGLSEDDQELVMLRYTEGMSVKDIAADLGERPNTVAQRLKRALQALRECLGVVPSRKTS